MSAGQTRTLLPLLLFFSVFPCCANQFRGIWVDAFGPGFFTTNEIKKLASDCRKYNFNAVIVEMRRRGDAFYFPGPSNPEPRTTIIGTNLDCLAELIRECHSLSPSDPSDGERAGVRGRRIEVHCWLVSHFIWAWDKPPSQPNHVFNLHPEYLTKDSIGQKRLANGYYLDPGNPDANQWIYNVAKDIVSRYDIDGLHWDYCRYPDRDSGYNETAIRRYLDESSSPKAAEPVSLSLPAAPQLLSEGRGERDGVRASVKSSDSAGVDERRDFKPETLNSKLPSPDDPRFCEWRRRQVTDFLRWVNADMLEIKPNLIISASVFANLNDSRNYRLADWAAWNREGILDLCMPMNFSTNNNSIFFPRTDEAWQNRGSRLVCIGQGAYMNTPENTLAQLNYIREKGFPGTVFYSYRSPNAGQPEQDKVFALIKEKFQPAWTDTPLLPWKKTKAIIKGIVTADGKDALHRVPEARPQALPTVTTGKDALQRVPIYNALVTLNTDPPRTQLTEPHGAFAFFDVLPGPHSVTVSAGKLTSIRKIETSAGKVSTVDFPLKGAQK